MHRPLKIAVVGSGISGLSAAWLLSHRHAVTLFEQDDRVGGHSNTVEAVMPTGSTAVDTGFIVYNTRSYPNLVALFEHLNVPTAATSMSFAVSLEQGRYEYSGSGLAGLFGQPSNALRPGHWRMIADMLRFFREAQSLLTQAPGTGPTLGEYLTANGYSEAFIAWHILPMAAAIWSTPTSDLMAFPAASFVRFLDNHGLLQANARADWRTVVGGSREYVRRMIAAIGTSGTDNLRIGLPILGIERSPGVVHLAHARGGETFDACVVAAHADQALALLRDADGPERDLLGRFRYTENEAVLHCDSSFMPQRRRLWSSWNYLGAGGDQNAPLSMTYWMNRLQPLNAADDLFVTLNPTRAVRSDRHIATFAYSHPMFDEAAMSAQRRLWSLQGRRKTWFCGSYFGYGFHEDGLQSGLAVAEDIGGVRRPWTVAEESGRIHLPPRAVVVENGRLEVAVQ